MLILKDVKLTWTKINLSLSFGQKTKDHIFRCVLACLFKHLNFVKWQGNSLLSGWCLRFSFQQKKSFKSCFNNRYLTLLSMALHKSQLVRIISVESVFYFWVSLFVSFRKKNYLRSEVIGISYLFIWPAFIWQSGWWKEAG